MSSIKTFLYTDKQTGQVIFAKKSRTYDYSFDLPGIAVSVIDYASTGSLSLKGGDHPLEKRKLEALIFLRTTECMMIEKIQKTLSMQLPLPNYEKVISDEERLALERVKKFFREKHALVRECTTPESISQFMKELSDRVNLGVYSAMNQERKNLDGESS